MLLVEGRIGMSNSNSLIKKYGEQLVKRDGYVCHYCGEKLVESISGFNERGASVDHIISQSEGGTDDLSNLVLACRRCNLDKGTKHYHQYRFRVETDGILMFLMEGVQ